MKKLSLLCGVFLFPFITLAQTEQNQKNEAVKLDSVVVQAFRAGKNTPVAWSSVNSGKIKDLPPSSSVPMLLNNLPSVVTTTEGGNGLGYTYMRVRGSDGSRINVTINGIALNDAESQEVFWVNLPALTSFVESIQLQRGVGTSVNGSGAFGASLNIQTSNTPQESYGLADFTVGSWNTFVSVFGAGSGELDNGLSFDVRYSNSHGKGYIRNSGGDLNSLFFRGGYRKNSDLFTFNFLYGDEKTGIAWNGISREKLASDRRYNPAGEYYDDAGNVRYYDNETDNYSQSHFQGSWQHLFSRKLSFSATLNYTNGFGYYENYKSDKKYSKYALPNQSIDGTLYSKSDFIIRQYLDNDYYAGNAVINYVSGGTKSVTGISYGLYDGDHFGRVEWSKFNNNIVPGTGWYFNNGNKRDISVFTKLEQRLGVVNMFLDLQYRRIFYRLDGPDDDFVDLKYRSAYSFFNPKAGITLNVSKRSSAYFSVAVGHKEPGRSDLKEAIKAGEAGATRSEKMTDFEGGYRYAGSDIAASANLYYMKYKDQLVPTGKLSETGYVIKENVHDSYRCGIEAEVSWNISGSLIFSANGALSRNKIKNYTMWTEVYDNPDEWNYLGQDKTEYKSTNIAYSPEIVTYAALIYTPVTKLSLTLNSKFVGKQFYDNSSRERFSIPAYNTFNLSAKTSFNIKKISVADVIFSVNNLFDRKYFSNGWVYSAEFNDGSPDYIEEGLFPQPGINYNLKISFRF